MKISKIEISNYLGLSRADINIATPVLMVLGANESGKSSLSDAISSAFLGEPRRVKLKKNLGQLLHDDAKKGRVTLLNVDEVLAEYKLPSGDQTCVTIPGAEFLPFLLDASLFARSDEATRRQMLSKLTNCKVSADATAELLLKRGARPEFVEEVKPLLRGGFPSTAKDAAERATQAKGAFRSITGDNWGSKQSEGWEPIIPEVPEMTDVSPAAIDKVIEQHAEVQAEVEKDIAYIAGLESKIDLAANYYTRRDELTEAFCLLDRAKKKLATDEKTLAELEETLVPQQEQLKALQAGIVPVPCPCCGENLRITGQTLEKYVGTKLDTKASSDMALAVTKTKGAIDMLKRTIANDIAAVTTAENAGKDLATLEKAGCPEVPIDAMVLAETALIQERLKADQLRAKVNAMKERQELIEGAEEAKTKAKQHHEDVLAWLLIAEALAPDGIPAEILATALKPVNDSLAILSRLSGWKKVEISRDMDITADGRIYGLMSESAKWRMDTLISLAIAQISELRFIVLDRFDVLDMTGRKQLIGMLMQLAEMGLMEQSIICGTLKAPLVGMPAEVGQVWINHGIVES